ncbi:MAG: pilus assembly protein TadG-related protein [Phreatobacter sp.]|nr:pilus assembly protein TadG-related protein [Phreatobacter sp.]
MDFCEKIFGNAARFRRNEGGGVALIFAICLIPLIGIMGMAVDYAQASRLQARLQSALDAAAVAASSRASGKTGEQIRADALAFFAAQFNEPRVGTPPVTAIVTSSTLELSSRFEMPASFLPVIGIPTVSVSANAKTAWGITRLRVALALDNTGSMSSAGKMAALKTATLNLIEQLRGNARNDGDIYVSIVPFAKVVNVGTAYRDANWIDFSGANVCNWRGVCSVSWDGAIQDRNQNFDISNAAPSGASSRFPALASGSTGGTPTAIQPLTYNWGQLRSTIAQMSPAGNTNQGIGLAWAWQTLTEGLPMNAPAQDPTYTYKKVIILLSDGINTESRFYTRATQIDARQRLMCDAIKAAGITIYTIQVNTGGDPTSAVLRYCASTSDKFTLMINPAQLDSTMQDIGGQLTRLRLTN